jgi:hypothetical protein
MISRRNGRREIAGSTTSEFDLDVDSSPAIGISTCRDRLPGDDA